MKRRTSAKTARDPNSRINKSLRKWNCEDGCTIPGVVRRYVKGGVAAPKGFHWMKKGSIYKLKKGAYKPHKGAVRVAKFAVQKRHGSK